METQNFTGDDFNDYINELIKLNRFSEKKEVGIAKLVIDKGFECLTEKQRFIFKNSIDLYVLSECKRCHLEIPWCKMSATEFNGGLCSWCEQLCRNDKT